MAASEAYRYDELAEGAHIRLMMIVPGQPGDPLKGVFLPCDLDADYYYFTKQDPTSQESGIREILESLKDEAVREQLSPAVAQYLAAKLRDLALDDDADGQGETDDDNSVESLGDVVSRLEPLFQPADAANRTELHRPFMGTAFGRVLAAEEAVEPQIFQMPMSYNSSSEEMTPHAFQPYSAISYCWGKLVQTEGVWLDGRVIQVSVALATCLKKMRDAEEGRLVWADALCIDQANPVEKVLQVRLMSRIYQQAERVTMYVGEADNKHCASFGPLVRSIQEAGRVCDRIKTEQQQVATEDGNALTRPPDLSEYEERYRTSSNRPVRLRDHGLLDPEHELWESWRVFFSSPYFQRVWVLQEVVFARKLELMWGPLLLRNPYEAFFDCMTYISEYSATVHGDWMVPSFDSIEEAIENAEKIVQASAGYKGLNTMFVIKAGQQSASIDGAPESEEVHGKSLVENMEWARGFQATDDRDRIYAVIGVSSDADLYSPHINYTDGMTTVYHTFARLFIEHGHGLRVLRQAAITRRKLPDDVPSWVPNWAAELGDLELSDPKQRDDEANAHRTTSNEAARMHILEDISRMSLPASIIDTVTARGPTFEPLHTGHPGGAEFTSLSTMSDFLRFYVKSMKMWMEAMKSDEVAESPDFLEPLFRTFINGPPDHAAAEVDEMRQGFRALMMEGVLLIEQQKLSPQVAQTHSDYLRKMSGWSRPYARAACVTSDRRIGLVSGTVEIGDKIAVVAGARTAFVLREVGNAIQGGEQLYKLVGEGYVHGILPEEYEEAGNHRLILV